MDQKDIVQQIGVHAYKGALSRRQFLQASAGFTMVALLAGCAAPAAPAAGGAEAAVPSTEAIRLNVLAENWGEIYNNLMTVIGDEYTKVNPVAFYTQALAAS